MLRRFVVTVDVPDDVPADCVPEGMQHTTIAVRLSPPVDGHNYRLLYVNSVEAQPC